MSKGSEHKFMKAVEADTRALYPGIVWARHTDSLLLGVADVEVAWQGVTSWFEFKWLELPQRLTTEIRLDKLCEPGQVRFLLERRAVGVPTWLIVGSAVGARVFEPSRLSVPLTVEGMANHPPVQRRGPKVDLGSFFTLQ